MGACQLLTVSRGPEITLETLDIHPSCNISTDCKQGEQNEPQIIISRCEFRCITQSAMSKPPSGKVPLAGQGERRGNVCQEGTYLGENLCTCWCKQPREQETG